MTSFGVGNKPIATSSPGGSYANSRNARENFLILSTRAAYSASIQAVATRQFTQTPTSAPLRAGNIPDKLSPVTATLTVNEVYLSSPGREHLRGVALRVRSVDRVRLALLVLRYRLRFREGKKSTVEAVVQQVTQLAAPYAQLGAAQRLPLVELTGGEPLLQRNSLLLMRALCDAGWTVLLETSGAHPIESVDPRVHRIVDLKCPSSGECDRNRWENVRSLRPIDEVKCVIATVEDYEWAKTQVAKYELIGRCPVLFSWAAPLSAQQQDLSLKPVPADHHPLSRQQLVERIIADALPVRFQVQMHKVIWSPDARSV